MSVCTWKDPVSGKCTDEGTVDQKDKHGRVWAQLCTTHDGKLNAAIDGGKPQQIMGAWIAANGGPDAMARKM